MQFWKHNCSRLVELFERQIFHEIESTVNIMKIMPPKTSYPAESILMS